jgi:hypothetical protein
MSKTGIDSGKISKFCWTSRKKMGNISLTGVEGDGGGER